MELELPKLDKPMLFDKDGNPLGIFEYSKMLADYEYKRVAEGFIGWRRISTVWIGLDMDILAPVPIIFETMAFDQRTPLPHNILGCWRTASVKEARRVHRLVMANPQWLRGDD